MVAIFALLGYLNVAPAPPASGSNHTAQRGAGQRLVINFTVPTDYMLRNDQEGLYRSIQTMAGEPGMEKIRIFDKEGRITYTTNAAELNQVGR